MQTDNKTSCRILLLIIRHVYDCKNRTTRPGVFYLWSLDTCMNVDRTKRPGVFYMWSLDTCMDANRQQYILSILLVIIRYVYDCKDRTTRPGVFYMWSLDTRMDVNRKRPDFFCVWLIDTCVDVYTMKNAFFGLCHVFTIHVCGYTQKEQFALACAMCVLQTHVWMCTAKKKKSLWRLLHAFTRYFPAHKHIKPALLQHMGHRAASGSQPCHLCPISNSAAILLIRMQNQTQIPLQLKDRFVLWMCDSV